MESFFYKKWLKTLIEQAHHQNELNFNVIEKPKIDKFNNTNNNRIILVGPSFSGKTYLMLKIISRRPDRSIYIITKAPPELYTTEIKIKEISD